MAMIFWDIFI